ncbi:MAG TPA: PAS domain-containing protein, partial [Albitalea sp.]|nr:PAS domain-containing protein [Albitalea sp.]
MTPERQDIGATDAAPWWRRLHGALMPDYNRIATLYWWTVVALGALTLGFSLVTLRTLAPVDLLQIGVGIAIAMLSGFFPVRIPRSTNSFAAGEIFIFLLLLLHGPAAAALAAAGEGLVGALRTSKRWTSRIATPAMACVAMYAAGSLLQASIERMQAHGWYSAAPLLVITMACAIGHFVLNTLLITALPYLKRSQWPALHELFGNFGWVGITFAGSASVACLLFLTFQQSGIGVLMAAAPIIAMLLTTLHYYFRRQEADETVRKSRIDAVEREAELAARHMRALEVSERRFHSAFTHASIGMALVSFDGQVLQVNSALRTLLGIDAGRAIERQPFRDVVDAADVAMLDKQLAELNRQQVQS